MSIEGVLESMRGKIIVALLLVQAVLIGCHNSISEIGSSLYTNTLFSIVYVDSTTLKVSTVRTDSLITSTTNRLLVGFHNDEKLGTISSKAIFQVGINSAVRLDRHTTDYVSLKLYLKRDGYSYYDTTEVQKIYLYQLAGELKPYKGFMYNTSRYKLGDAPLGTLTFLPRPHQKDSIEIALPDELGRQFMTMAQTNDIRFSAADEFMKFFRGLALVPDSSSSRNMIGFATKAELRLYYRDNTVTPSLNLNKHVSFSLGSNAYFNSIFTNREGTALASVRRKNDLVSSNAAGHEAYIQSGAGLAIRVEMPYVRDYLLNDRNFQVTRAVLELMPIHTYVGDNPPPNTLYIYRVDALNRLLTVSPQGAVLLRDVESGANTHYQADITAFVNSQIQTDQVNNNAMLILLDDNQFRSTVNRVYIGDKKNQFAMKIKLYYISLSNQYQ